MQAVSQRTLTPNFKVLGPLEITIDERRLPLGPPKRQIVLATLLLSANRLVTVDSLIDTIWEEAPPRSATANVYSHITALRRAFSEWTGGDRLSRRTGGYVLEIGPEELDLTLFEELTAHGRAALARGEIRTGAESLRQALDLWRGEPLAGISAGTSLDSKVTRLREQRLGVQEEWLGAELAGGGHGDLVPRLRTLVTEFPLRERLWCLLMTALSGAGRNAEALAVYGEARDRLVELGLEPGAELQRLQRAVLLGEQAPSEPPPELVTTSLRQLPPDGGHFVGRDESIDELLRGLETQDPTTLPLVVVTGKPGIGKTALALRTAHRLTERYPDGQLFVDLRGAEAEPLDPSEVLERFLRALGVPGARIPADLDGRTSMYRDRMAGLSVLVLLDNAAAEAQVRPLLPGSARCAVMITSRSGLGGLDSVKSVNLQVLESDPSLRLLVRLIGADRVGTEPEAAQHIVDLCGGLPLAVRIVGAKLQTRPQYSLSAFAAHLANERQRLDALTAGDREIRASFALSYQNLTEPERAAFRSLAILQVPDIPGFVLPALLGAEPVEAQRLMDQLVEANLVDVLCGGPTTRYRMHDLLRLFAVQCLADDDAAAVRTRFRQAAGVYLGLARLADTQLEFGGVCQIDSAHIQPVDDTALTEDVERDPLGWFSAERVNLMHIIRQAARTGVQDLTYQLSCCLSAYFDVHSNWNDWQESAELSRQAAIEDGERLWEAYALFALGLVHREQGRYDVAREHLDQCLELCDELGEIKLRLLASLGLGVIHRRQCRWTAAIESFEWCVTVLKELGSTRWHAYALRELGVVLRQQGRWDEATESLQQALRSYRDLNDLRWAAATLRELGIILRAQCQYAQAYENFTDCLTTFRKLGDRRREAATLRSIGILHHEMGLYEEADQLLSESLRLLEEFGDRHGMACTTVCLADVVGRRGDPATAIALLEKALPDLTELGNLRWQARALTSLGGQLWAMDREDEARRAWQAARECVESPVVVGPLNGP